MKNIKFIILTVVIIVGLLMTFGYLKTLHHPGQQLMTAPDCTRTGNPDGMVKFE